MRLDFVLSLLAGIFFRRRIYYELNVIFPICIYINDPRI